MAQGGRGPEEVRQRALDAGAVPALLRLLSSKHAETIACASSCLLCLCRHAPARAAAVACGGLVQLAEHLRSGPPRLQKEAAWMLHLVGNHSTEGKAQLKEVGMLRHPAVLRAAVEWEAYRMQHALQL